MKQTERPVIMALTRQDLPTFDRTKYAPVSGAARGGYVLADSAGKNEPEVILMSTGSEVQLAVAAHEKLAAAGIRSRVVSLPSFELFDEQPAEYRDQVLPRGVTARVAVEAGIRQCWDKYLGCDGEFIGLDTFGASAPYQEIYKHRGLTAEAVIAAAKQQLGR
jgi:transketolase